MTESKRRRRNNHPVDSDMLVEFERRLDGLTYNSRKEIEYLTYITSVNIHRAPLFVDAILRRAFNILVLYVLDNIVRNVGQPFTMLFEQHLIDAFSMAYTSAVSRRDINTTCDLRILFESWTTVFSPVILNQIYYIFFNVQQYVAPSVLPTLSVKPTARLEPPRVQQELPVECWQCGKRFASHHLMHEHKRTDHIKVVAKAEEPESRSWLPTREQWLNRAKPATVITTKKELQVNWLIHCDRCFVCGDEIQTRMNDSKDYYVYVYVKLL